MSPQAKVSPRFLSSLPKQGKISPPLRQTVFSQKSILQQKAGEETMSMSLVSFHTLWKHRKIWGCLIFSRGCRKRPVGWNELNAVNFVLNVIKVNNIHTRMTSRDIVLVSILSPLGTCSAAFRVWIRFLVITYFMHLLPGMALNVT